MEQLPSIEAVASAKEETLYKLWEGLGYYSRVRNIQKGARYILEKHGGKVPESEQELLQVPGLGPYTANAILCFAMKKRAYPVDANVIRVLARIYKYQERVDTSAGKNFIRDKLVEWVPENDPHLVAEGLIEFGQKICAKIPACNSCFLRNQCSGREKALQLPIKKTPPKITKLKREVAICIKQERVFLFKEQSGGIMEGLWQFPYGDIGFTNRKHVAKTFAPIVHGFTRFHVTLFPIVLLDQVVEIEQKGEWIALKDIPKLSFSSGHRKIAQMITEKKFIDSLLHTSVNSPT